MLPNAFRGGVCTALATSVVLVTAGLAAQQLTHGAGRCLQGRWVRGICDQLQMTDGGEVLVVEHKTRQRPCLPREEQQATAKLQVPTLLAHAERAASVALPAPLPCMAMHSSLPQQEQQASAEVQAPAHLVEVDLLWGC